MSILDKMIFDQEIICKSLHIFEEVMIDSDDTEFFTKEIRERLHDLIKQEHEKLYMLEKQRGI